MTSKQEIDEAAARLYADRHEEAQRRIRRIIVKLALHAAKRGVSLSDYGYTARLGHLNELLDNAERAISDGEAEE